MIISDKRLKPCPLCGSKDIVIKIPIKGDGYFVQIFCVKRYGCGLTGFKHFPISKKEDDIFGSLIKYWNTRYEVTE